MTLSDFNCIWTSYLKILFHFANLSIYETYHFSKMDSKFYIDNVNVQLDKWYHL